MITVRQLAYFAQAAQDGSATRAAQALHVSQPSVSAAIRELEETLGRKLFHRRQAQGLELTPFGVEKLREAREILARVKGMEAAPGGPARKRLALGYFVTLGPSWISGAVARIARDLPGLEVDLRECDLEELSRLLERGVIDLAVGYDLGLPAAAARSVLAEVRPHALLPPRHPLAAQEAVALADLAREPFILVDLPVSRELLMAPFWERGLSPWVLLRTGSVEMVRSMVASGLGVSLLFTRPRSEVTPDGGSVLTRPLRDEVASQRLVAASMAPPGAEAVLAEAVAAIRAHAEGALTGSGRS